MGGSDTVRLWNPWNVLVQKPTKIPYAILILNRPIDLNLQSNFVWNLWSNAALKVTVDGGTSRWLSWLKLNNFDGNREAAPDLITGDLDSTTPDVINFFLRKSKQVAVVETANQDETDFTKALREVQKYIRLNGVKIETSIVLCDTSGRFDQILANVNTLYKAETILPNVWILQLGSNSLTWLLGEGYHHIHIPQPLIDNREWCSLIPIGAPCRVTTSGLKWNLKNSEMRFGELVSTSNTYEGDPVVTIKTDSHVVWSMGIENLL